MDKMTGKDDFITTWRFTGDFKTPALSVFGEGVFLVDWGDGCVEKTTSARCEHTYHQAGDFDIRITGRLTSFSSVYQNKIIDIKQWGASPWEDMSGIFTRATHLNMTATDAPDLSRVTDLSYLFSGCSVFNGKVGHWDVSTITNMQGMFQHAHRFNQPLSGWTVGQVKDMQYLLSDCNDFQQDLSNWGAGEGRTTSDLPNSNNLFGTRSEDLKTYNARYEERQAKQDRDVMKEILK